MRKRKSKLVEQLLSEVNQPLLRVCYDEWFLTMRFQLEEEFIELIQWATDYSIRVGEERCMTTGLKKAITAVPDDRLYDSLIDLYQHLGDEAGRAKWLQKKKLIEV
ncbi:hypothetical protein [Alkalicoccobacillus plakortidis]|uniref:ComN-like post-transcriptional regulator n=1 Tax=Alkalicoccobacillus plakortidis TaxID=444060 RepID=A0ABT0XJ99_9BACI|nr:hypothetical protein [Alkalicoccobacillus plakortidis]MCM2675922.1 hypothetical protein [Alkalicoccobacillus plakortidis]